MPLIVQPGWHYLHSVVIPPTRMAARMWYSFFPAEDTPEDKPLLLLMQGGPGVSMLPLWGGNTGPRTLDPRRSDGSAEENLVSWTRFANLLYIDTSLAGFSYERRIAEAPESSYDPCTRDFDADEEAASYTRVLLRFLERHPQLRPAKVALVGESYGGVRATLMLQQLLHPERLREPPDGYVDPELADEIEDFARGDGGPRSSVSLLARQSHRFFAQILIQPVVLGEMQNFGLTQRACSWPGGKTQGEVEGELLAGMLRELDSGSALARFVGVDVDSIRWFHAEERSHVCDRPAAPEQADLALSQTFGVLAAGDRFYVRTGGGGTGGGGDRIRRSKRGDRPGSRLADLFVENLRRVSTFITNADCDVIVASEEITTGLVKVAGVAEVVALETGDDVLVSFDDGQQRKLRFPSYPGSGHIVALHAPEQIARDVERFLAETLAGRE